MIMTIKKFIGSIMIGSVYAALFGFSAASVGLLPVGIAIIGILMIIGGIYLINS